ncbi:MAG: 6-phosphogluconolactonase [Betaproteobacteria bacterium]
MNTHSYFPGPKLHRMQDEAELAGAVAAAVQSALTQTLEQHEHATLVLSGGSTPEIYLPKVAELDIPWSRVRIMLADERWVSEDSPDSNTAMLRRKFLSLPGPAQAEFIPLKNSAATADAGVAETRAGLPPLDEPISLVLLGMGNDGHFASLFPDTPRLEELLSPDNDERVAAIPAPATASPSVARITLTLAEIQRSEHVVLVLQGARKLDVLEHAWEETDELHFPVFALGEVDVLWAP